MVFSAGNDPNGRGQRAIKAVPATGVITGSAAPPTRPRGSRPAARSTPRSRPHLPASGTAHASRERKPARTPRRRDQSLRPLPLDWRTGLVAAATLCRAVCARARVGSGERQGEVAVADHWALCRTKLRGVIRGRNVVCY
ncbi:hypothetical protein [uncultured Thiohalocapsa sp.]|uniref:hypothetical protein n=1 Tax=uncultured Thiohalocapsa sp. TaxID=768990 RepID=UPI0025CE031A|nr:hypothetical protein [uncultured Thiohalocapsa sp.]